MPRNEAVFYQLFLQTPKLRRRSGATLPAWVTESDIDVYVAECTRSGFRGPLSWWRNIDRG